MCITRMTSQTEKNEKLRTEGFVTRKFSILCFKKCFLLCIKKKSAKIVGSVKKLDKGPLNFLDMIEKGLLLGKSKRTL